MTYICKSLIRKILVGKKQVNKNAIKREKYEESKKYEISEISFIFLSFFQIQSHFFLIQRPFLNGGATENSILNSYTFYLIFF